MRHGLIRWDEKRLSAADVTARQDRLRDAMARHGIDGLVIYTNHVRSGALTWAAGFTPYWSDALWYLPRAGRPVLSTALSKRVGKWIAATNPTSEITHSPSPGGAIGQFAADQGAARLGVVELDRMPRALVDQIAAAHSGDLVDASELFAGVRAASDLPEMRLVDAADALARDAFAAVPETAASVGEIAGPLELEARLGGAEEIYVATAPELAADTRFARRKGDVALGRRHAARATVARHGVWIRRIETLDPTAGSEIADARDWLKTLCAKLKAEPGIAEVIGTTPLPARAALAHWRLEAPAGTRPLQTVAALGTDLAAPVAYGVLTVRLDMPGGPVVLARPIHGAGSR